MESINSERDEADSKTEALIAKEPEKPAEIIPKRAVVAQKQQVTQSFLED